MSDDLPRQADRLAEKMQISRDRLISLAVDRYLRQREREEIVQQLNEVFGGESDTPERAIAVKTKAKFCLLLSRR